MANPQVDPRAIALGSTLWICHDIPRLVGGVSHSSFKSPITNDSSMDEDDNVDNDIIEDAKTKTVKKKRFPTKTVKKKHQPKQVIVPVPEDNDETVDNNSDKIDKVLDILNN